MKWLHSMITPTPTMISVVFSGKILAYWHCKRSPSWVQPELEVMKSRTLRPGRTLEGRWDTLVMPVVETADAEWASAAARKPADTAASVTKHAVTQNNAHGHEALSAVRLFTSLHLLLHSFLFTLATNQTLQKQLLSEGAASTEHYNKLK